MQLFLAYLFLVFALMTVGTFSPLIIFTGTASICTASFLSIFLGREWLQQDWSMIISWLVFCFSYPAFLILLGKFERWIEQSGEETQSSKVKHPQSL